MEHSDKAGASLHLFAQIRRKWELALVFSFFCQIATGGHPAQSETTKLPSRGKAPLRMRQRSLAAPFWAVRAQQGGFSENYPAFSRPRAVWQLLRL